MKQTNQQQQPMGKVALYQRAAARSEKREQAERESLVKLAQANGFSLQQLTYFEDSASRTTPFFERPGVTALFNEIPQAGQILSCVTTARLHAGRSNARKAGN